MDEATYNEKRGPSLPTNSIDACAGVKGVKKSYRTLDAARWGVTDDS